MTAIRTHLHTYLCAEEHKLIANRREAGAWEQFELVTFPDDHRVALLSTGAGKYVSANYDGTIHMSPHSKGDNEKWVVEKLEANVVAFRSTHGRFLSCEGEHRIVADRGHVGINERFHLTNPEVLVALEKHHHHHNHHPQQFQPSFDTFTPPPQPIYQQPAPVQLPVQVQVAPAPVAPVEQKLADGDALLQTLTQQKFRIFNANFNSIYVFLSTEHKMGGDVVAIGREDMDEEVNFFQLMPTPNGLYRIYHPASNQFLYVSDHTLGGDRVVLARGDIDHASAHFHFVHLGGTRFRIQNAATGTADGECVLFGAHDKTENCWTIEARAGLNEPRAEFDLLVDTRSQLTIEGQAILSKMETQKFRLHNQVFHETFAFVAGDKIGGDHVVELRANMNEERNYFQLQRTMQKGMYRIFHPSSSQYLFVSQHEKGGDRIVQAREELDDPVAHFRLVYLGNNQFRIENPATATKDGDCVVFPANDKTGGDYTLEARAGMVEPRRDFTVMF